MIKVLHTEASLGWGGQEIRILEEAKGLRKKGYWIGLAASPESEIFKRFKKEGFSVYPVNFKKYNLGNVLKLIKILKKEKIYILNTHSSWDSWIGAIAKLFYPKIKLVRTRHLSTPIGKNFFSYFVYNIMPDAIITTGEAIRLRMIEHNKFNPEKIFSIPTGVDLERFNPSKVRPVFKEKGPKIGMISVLRSWKGHKYFIKAIPDILKFLPDAKFYIVGKGPQRKNIEKLIKDLNLENKVYLLGHREDIPEILAGLDVLVHPSTRHEGVPQTILQALAMEKAVVASCVGSIPEVIKHLETGYLIPPESSEAISKAIIELFQNSEILYTLGKKGRKFVEKNYSFDLMIFKIEEIYKKILK